MIRTFYIKNMVCQKCINILKKQFENNNIKIDSISLGKIAVKYSGIEIPRNTIVKILYENNFELLSDKDFKLINQVKDFINDLIDRNTDKAYNNSAISNLIDQKFEVEYNFLNNLFAFFYNISIEYYLICQKIEKAKELIKYDKLRLEEIYRKLGYGSIDQLSRHFKTLTGLTVREFRNLII